MNRCVIVGGAAIGNYNNVRRYLRDDDFFIFCDCGLNHIDGLGVRPDLIIGDFDSHDNPNEVDTETIVLPTVKDDTDTVYAAKEGMKRGFTEFLLLGAAGGRLDHTMGNVSILLMLREGGCHGVLLDDYSEMEIVGSEPVYVGPNEHGETCSFFSLLSIFGNTSGVNISGAKYNLDDGEINCDYQYGISNEVAGRGSVISVKNGKLLLVKVYREQKN